MPRLYQQQRQLRNIGGQQQYRDDDTDERPDPLDDPFKRNMRHRGAHEQVDAVGRSDKANGQVHGHDDTEVDGIDTQCHRHRQQDGSQDGAAGDVVQKSAQRTRAFSSTNLKDRLRRLTEVW